jgi:hypothetical protein
MNLIMIVILVLVVLFGFVILFGAPYLPTLNKQTKEALDLLDLKPGQTLLELGSGDGRVLRAAAKRGIKAIGYEINPLLVVWSLIACWRYRSLVRVRWANFWTVKLPNAEGVYTFLLQRYMANLDAKIINDMNKGTKLVSFGFHIPDKRSAMESDALYLYNYPSKRS